MESIHRWAWGCGLVSGAVSLFFTDPTKALLAAALATGLTYILGPVVVFILGE
jgi:hypothetical protein